MKFPLSSRRFFCAFKRANQRRKRPMFFAVLFIASKRKIAKLLRLRRVLPVEISGRDVKYFFQDALL